MLRNKDIFISDEKTNVIIKKIKDEYFFTQLKEIQNLYLENSKDSDMLFLDFVLNLEPVLKSQIRANYIAESEMDYIIDFYGSFVND